MNVGNVNTGAVNWESLLSKLGDVTKTEGANGVAGTTNVTITRNVDGVETPVVISIPDDLEIPEVIDQAAIDSLCEKLAADTGLNLTEEEISQFRDALSSALDEVAASAASGTSGTSSSVALSGAMFDLYKLMALLVEVAQKQRDATREMRQSENEMMQQSILNQAEAQRTAAMTGMIAGAICCAVQVGFTVFALVQQAKAFNAQLGTDKTAGLDVARQNVDMTKAANNEANAQSQLSKVRAEVGNKTASTGARISQHVGDRFSNNNVEFRDAEINFTEAKNSFQTKVAQNTTLKLLSSDAHINEVTSDAIAPFEGPEMTNVKTAVAKLDAYKAEVAKLDQLGLSAEDKAFFIEKSTQPFSQLSVADKIKLMNMKAGNGALDGINLGDKPLAQLQADVKAGFDEAILQTNQEIAPNGKLSHDMEVAKENYRAQVKLEVQKFEDAYDSALKDYNEVSKTGTKAEIAHAETKLQTAANELKYARALGNTKLANPEVTDAKTHLADVEDARTKFNIALNTRANSVDYIKATNAITKAQAMNNLISAVGGFAQGFIQSLTQYQQAEATEMGAQQKKAEEDLDQTRDLFNQAEELVNNVVQLMQAVRTAEAQSQRDAIQA